MFRRFVMIAACAASVTAFAPCGRGQEHEHHKEGADAGKPVILLDKPRVMVLYQLDRLSNAQLLLVDRQPTDPKYAPVYEAIVARPGVDSRNRREAITALAKINKSDDTAEIVAALKRISPEKAPAVLADLSRTLVSGKPDDLKKQKTALEALATEAPQAVQKEAALAALAAFEDPAPVWEFAQGKGALGALLSGLAILPDAQRRSAFFERTEPLLKSDTQPDVLRGAMMAAASMSGREAGVFGSLSTLFQAGKERPAAVRAVQRIPKDKWPADQLKPLADAIVDYAGKVPAAARTESDYLDLTQLGRDLAGRLPKEAGAAVRKTLSALGVNVVRLRTLHEQMLFDKNLIVAEAGKPIEIIFENTDAMQHNIVVLAPGALEEIGQAAEKMPPTPDDQGRLFVPDSPKVLFATAMLNPGDRTKLSFTAPSKADKYPYVCTYPGHWRRMVGTLLVVENLEEYMAQNPEEPTAPVITEWKMEDLEADLAKIRSGLDYSKGKQLFTMIGCVGCHQVGQEGVAFGPNLTAVFAKYKDDPKAVLGEILDPSKTIEPRYRNYTFKPASGEPFNGMIVKEEGDAVFIQTGPSDALIQKFIKKDVAGREASALSVMPPGLMNLLNKDQIFDLLAFLASGGDEKHAVYK